MALKVARPEQTRSAAMAERFLREARAAANLLHPHIVAVFDSGQDGPHRYIASALVRGQSLDVVLGQQPKGRHLPARQAVPIVRRLADALAYAHKQGVIHRDVKPGNVMLREDGEPMLMDFGLAARADEERLTEAGVVLGTPANISPERWQGNARAASDQYSLGCLLFELLTGRLPFVAQDGDVQHYLFLHVHQPAPSPRALRPDLPRDLETICLKCLHKNPCQRFAGCQELADDLRRWLEGEPVQARPPGAGERLVKWARRSPAVAALTLATMTSLLLGAAVASFFAWWAFAEASGARQLALEEAEARKRAQKHEEEALGAKALADQAKKRADTGLHALQLEAAVQAWKQNDVHRAQAILSQVAAPYRDTWEHRHVQTLCWRHLPLLSPRHAGSVRGVAYSPDGRRIASGSGDKTVKVWDAQTGREILSLRGHTDSVLGVAYSPEGDRIASAGQDNTARVWDAQTGREIFSLKGKLLADPHRRQASGFLAPCPQRGLARRVPDDRTRGRSVRRTSAS